MNGKNVGFFRIWSHLVAIYLGDPQWPRLPMTDEIEWITFKDGTRVF